MKKYVWLLETNTGDYSVYESLEDARDKAELMILREYEDGIFDKDDLIGCLKELTEDYNPASGFCVDEVLWCWKVPYLSRGDM